MGFIGVEFMEHVIYMFQCSLGLQSKSRISSSRTIDQIEHEAPDKKRLRTEDGKSDAGETKSDTPKDDTETAPDNSQPKGKDAVKPRGTKHALQHHGKGERTARRRWKTWRKTI